ncbi:GNAT family N-acetyltransferase [Mycobacterium sp. M26]|uniref:GNAT family N-acetyltransferase n=1 Tax=Mycobacterium sp. M26 TaxID=1762962 RepID=UPI00073EF03A|nr:GNAT family N-acetyltransferase [Mycobacterium sp. M26]
MTTTDKTGAPTTVGAEHNQFTISVDGHEVGLAAFVDRDNQRIFHHTEVADAYEGRGLATILITDALAQTRAAGLRIVAVCPMVAAFVDKHREYDDVVDPVTDDIEHYLRQAIQPG